MQLYARVSKVTGKWSVEQPEQIQLSKLPSELIFLSSNTVRDMFDYTRNGLNKMVKAGRFPRPLKMGDERNAPVRWRLSDIEKWVDEREVLE